MSGTSKDDGRERRLNIHKQHTFSKLDDIYEGVISLCEVGLNKASDIKNVLKLIVFIYTSDLSSISSKFGI